MTRLNGPLVSIIVPTFNKVEFVVETLHSALNQTYAPIEIIVVDDGSSDGTHDILLREVDGKFILLTQQNCGVESARNVGWTASSGDLITFLDADDLMSPDRVAAQVVEFINHEDLVLLGTAARVVNASGIQIGTIHPPLENESLQFMLSFSNPFVCSSVMIRRSSIEGVPFNVTSNRSVAEDYELWVRLARKGTIRNLQPEYTTYRRLTSSRSQSPDTQPFLSACEIAVRQLIQISPSSTSSEELEELVRIVNGWGLIMTVKQKIFSFKPLVLYWRILRRKGIVLQNSSPELRLIALRHFSKIFTAEVVRMIPRLIRHRFWHLATRLQKLKKRTF